MISILFLLTFGPPSILSPSEGGIAILPTLSTGLQEPEDPSRVLNLLDGLIDRIQESSPFLATIIRFLAIIVYLVLNIKAWGPSVLITAFLVAGFLVWQSRRKKNQPMAEQIPETEPEL